MVRARLVASVPALARAEGWATAKERGALTIVHGDREVEVALVEQPKVGNLVFYLAECPGCGRLARDLLERDGQLGCRRCLRVLHPDQALSGSRWNRRVVRPVRQISRLNARLGRRDLDRNHRRRLRRRRRRLLQQVEQELAQRQLDLHAGLALAWTP